MACASVPVGTPVPVTVPASAINCPCHHSPRQLPAGPHISRGIWQVQPVEHRGLVATFPVQAKDDRPRGRLGRQRLGIADFCSGFGTHLSRAMPLRGQGEVGTGMEAEVLLDLMPQALVFIEHASRRQPGGNRATGGDPKERTPRQDGCTPSDVA
jgi:hypothetical protein